MRVGSGPNILNPIASARLRTANRFGVTYGRFEARAQLPAGKIISVMGIFLIFQVSCSHLTEHLQLHNTIWVSEREAERERERERKRGRERERKRGKR